MNIKSLLIGSAAAIVAATGARAADAIVIAEPEPVEYVRICDTYGVGYFYIPGTETCLRVGGWIRAQVNASEDKNGWNAMARGRLEINSRNESEWGTVAGYYRLDSRLTNGQGRNADRDNQWNAQYSLGVGGLELGFRDSALDRWFGYGGFTDDGGLYGYSERHYISYSFATESFTGFVSVDHDDNLNYVPDVSAGIGGFVGPASALVAAGYDESQDNFGVKARLNGDLGVFKATLIGFYANGDNSYWYYKGATGDAWSVLGGLQASLTEKTIAALDVQYFDNGDWRFGGNVGHEIAPGLSTLVEVIYSKPKFDVDNVGGFLRFQRSF